MNEVRSLLGDVSEATTWMQEAEDTHVSDGGAEEGFPPNLSAERHRHAARTGRHPHGGDPGD